MNCQQIEKLIITNVYGSLSHEEDPALKEHLSRCLKCRSRWEKTRSLRKQAVRIVSVALPDPENSWEVIAERLSSRHRMSVFRLKWRWVPAVGALLFIFATGFFFGRRLLISPSPSQTAWPSNLSARSLETYADFLQPVLVNFVNQDGVQSSSSLRRLERRIVSDLLGRTRLLKSLIPDNSSSALRELLQDLEFILTAMDNLEPGDKDTARHLAGLILDNEVSLRLRQFIENQMEM